MVMPMTSLFPAVLMLTGTTANDVTQDLSLPPLSEHLLLLDVTSDASVVDVKESLCGLNVRHRFKVEIRAHSTLQCGMKLPSHYSSKRCSFIISNV